MSEAYSVWFRPPRGRWRKVGEAATEGDAWTVQHDALRTHGSGGYYICPPGRPAPTPREGRQEVPATQGVIQWD